MDSIDLSGLSIADPDPSQSDQGNLGDESALSPKLRDKLNKLAKWRIDPSLIEFPKDTPEFEGGHATVSRALLIPASATGVNEPKNVKGGQSHRDGSIKKKVVAVKKLKTEDTNNSERVLEEEHGNLKDFVASQDWEIPERISLISDVTYGVQHLHSRNPPILHGDLKSINVLVTSRCRAVITDFGSARRLAKKGLDAQTTRTEKREAKLAAPDFQATFCATSNTMTFTGNEYTLRWAAPELLMDDEPSLSSDIWALGWIFYEVMTNSIPFENVQKNSIIIKHVVDGKLPSVTDHVRVSLILKLSSLMVKCWDVDPTKRPTAEDCRKSFNWMPTVIPALQQGATSKARSPELLMQLGTMYRMQDDHANASNLYTEALSIYTETSYNEGKASALYQLGQVHAAQGKYDTAATFYTKSLQVHTDIGYEQGRADALWGLAKLHKRQKEYGEAIELYSEVVRITLATGNETQRANALNGLAGVKLAQKNYDQAVTAYSEAAEIYTKRGGMFGKAAALWGLAETYRLQENYTQAITFHSESLQICTDIGDRFGMANALLCLAHIHLNQSQHNDAICLYEQAGAIFEQIGHALKAARASSCAARAREQLEAARAG